MNISPLAVVQCAMVIRVALVNDDEVVVRGLDAMMRNYGDRVEIVELVAQQATSSTRSTSRSTTRSGWARATARRRTPGRQPARPQGRRLHLELPAVADPRHPQAGRPRLPLQEPPAARLVDALHAIAAGRVVVSPSRRAPALVGGDWPGREEGLTAREAEVLSLITMGLSNQEIAERTSLSLNSIKSYIRSAYRKIDVDSRSKAVLWGVEHGMRADRVRLASQQDTAGERTA